MADDVPDLDDILKIVRSLADERDILKERMADLDGCIRQFLAQACKPEVTNVSRSSASD